MRYSKSSEWINSIRWKASVEFEKKEIPGSSSG